LGKPIHDVDIATSAYPAEVKNIFRRTVDVGIKHGTVMVLQRDNSYEVTTFRTEGKYQNYRRPESVSFVRSLEEDLKRRDFTINALAMNRIGEITDLFAGQEDLEKELIRAVGEACERFHEDSLRMMRAFRFVSQLGFAIEEETYQAIISQISLLEEISAERIQIEFLRMMVGEFRNKGLKAFIETNAFLYVPVLSEDHRNALFKLLELPDEVIYTRSQVWALIAYFLKFSKEEFKHFLREWKESRANSKESQLVLKCLKKRERGFWTKEELYHTGLTDALLTEELVQLIFKRGEVQRVKEEFAQLAIKSRSEIVVRGGDLQRELKRSPGEWLGDMLFKVESAIINGDLLNDYSAIIDFLTQLESEL
jgi:tRNA nucleotidyltransferase (CCA-adding enzyme)